MSLFSNSNDLKLLQNLLKPQDESSSDSEDDQQQVSGNHKIGPADIFVANTSSKNKKVDDQRTNRVQKYLKNTPSSLEEWEQLEDENTALLNEKIKPDYTVSYKQKVCTEDVFLQMNEKTPSTSDCEEIILKIKLSNEEDTMDQMKLSVQPNEINLVTSLYNFNFALTHTINPDLGKAFWNNNTKTLTLVLKT